MTDFPITALRSVDLVVPDLAAAEAFYTGTWGLVLVDRAAGTSWLRASGADAQVLALHAGPRAAIRSASFRAADAASMARVLHMATTAGASLMQPPAPLAEPGGGLSATLRDPFGAVLRLVCDDTRRVPDPPAPDRPDRLAHINLNCADVDATAGFFEAGLGFRMTDRSKLMAFERCNADHHAVVLAEAPADGLNHIAFQMPGLEAVMRGAGRVVDAGLPIGWGPGRHGPGDNVFAYFVDPFGFVVEYTAEVEQVDDSHVVRGPSHWVWPPGRTDQWGIAPPKSAACKAAQTAMHFA